MLRVILAEIDERLDCVIERRFLGTPVELQPVKVRKFQAMCEQGASENELYKKLSFWLSSCDEDEAEEFCSFLYNSLPSWCGKYISNYCRSHRIRVYWLEPAPYLLDRPASPAVEIESNAAAGNRKGVSA